MAWMKSGNTPNAVKRTLSIVLRVFAQFYNWIRFHLLREKEDITISRQTFDSEWYLASNPDAATYAGSLFEHFIRHGANEGRSARFFDRHWYTRLYDDLRFSRFDAWTHYQRYGKEEGRQARYFYVNLAAAGSSDVRTFEEWAAIYETLDSAAVQEIHTIIKTFELDQSFDVLLNFGVDDTDVDAVYRTVLAVKDQIYPHFSCIIGLDPGAPEELVTAIRRAIGRDQRFQLESLAAGKTWSAGINILTAQAKHKYFCAFTTQDILHPTALFWVAYSLKMEKPDAAIIYADEDYIDNRGRRSKPYFKPAFNYELFLTHNMLGDFVIYRRDLFDQLGGLDETLALESAVDLAFRMIEASGPENVLHIPRLLNHIQRDVSPATNTESVKKHFARTGQGGTILPHAELAGYNRIRFVLPDNKPLVTIIIPTRDRVELLRMAVTSVLKKTTYTPFEVIIVDNGSVEPDTLTYFKELKDTRVRILPDDSPFNFSALNNKAVAAARGDYVCLMNNDIEILTPDWLEEMMSFAVRPDIGCVGARLWYPDGTLQHAGVLVGFHGVAGHMHKFLPRGNAGYANRAALQQSLSAVTAAVLLVRKSLYEAVGGFDESLAVAFNDVDFCLKVRNAGYRNVYTPFAEMNHHESASRGAEDSPEKKAREKAEIEIIKQRYGDSLMRDPAYNPNLTLLREDLSFAFPPRVRSTSEILAEAVFSNPGLEESSEDRNVL